MVVVSTSFSPPADGVLHQSPSTKLLVNDQELGTATLYITEQNVVWGGGVRPSGGPAPSISLLYPYISLHGVQREPSAALFMVLNYELRLPELAQQVTDEYDDDFDADEQPITQLRFVPANENELQAMYSAMTHGQSLHPDPTDEVEDDDDDPYMDGEEFDEGSEEFEDALERGASPDLAARMPGLRLDQANAHHQSNGTEDADIVEE